MGASDKTKLEIACPCCGARLKVDAELGKVLFHEPPPKQAQVPDLDHAADLLAKEKARRESLFAESAEEEKLKSQLLERKFEESLKKTGKEPVTRPLRDFDLD